MQTARMMGQDLAVLCRNWAWFLTWGIGLFVLGLFAIYADTMTTMISVVLLGVLLSLAGVMLLVDAFTTWRQHKGSFLFKVIMGALYLIAGILLIENPILGSISITFLLGAFYVFVGIFRIMDAMSFRYIHWGWVMLNGFITLLLGLMILASWPASSLFILGLFVGIDLIFCGIAYIMAAMGARSLLNNR